MEKNKQYYAVNSSELLGLSQILIKIQCRNDFLFRN